MVYHRKVPLRLQIWLDSVVMDTHKECPPIDFMDYTEEGGTKFLYCVFHESLIEGDPAYFTMHNEETGEAGRVAMCDKCHTHMNKILSDTQDTKGRIRFYLETGNLPSDAAYYCTGHKHDQNCVFCHEQFQDRNEAVNRMYFPQGEVDLIYGSMLVCYDCDRELIKQLSNRKKTRSKTAYFETCPNCEKGYQVCEREHFDRVEYGTVTEHVCDKCLIEEGFLNELRILDVGCNECESTIIVDRSLYSTFKAIIGKENYIPKYCEKCAAKNQDISLTNHEVWLEGDILLTVYKVGMRWAYSIEKQVEVGEEQYELQNIVDTLGVQEFDELYLAVINGTYRYYRELKQQLEIPFMNED